MFENLKDKLNKELEAKTKEAMKNYGDYLTPKESEKVELGKKTIGDYAAKISSKVYKRYFQKYFEKLTAAELQEAKVQSIEISVEWFRSATWGSNPEAKVIVRYDNEYSEAFSSERIGGCGYDKESTAIGQALNQCTALMKELYLLKDSNVNASNSDCIGYGAGYGILPYFEGGVGFSCHRNILEKLGFTYEYGSSGKTFDTYRFIRKEEA